MRTLALAACALGLALGPTRAAKDAGAAEPPAVAQPAVKAANPLAGLPSKAEGAHIEKIRALGNNSWAILGQAAADPNWGQEGVARGRAFSPRMPYAPDLGGAFFCGTGVHGAKRSDGRYMDDLWFYDANAHRWICLYPGADPKTLKLHLDKNGLEVNEAGDHIPVSYLSHGYYNTTYNPDLKLYHVIWTQCPWWGKILPQRWEWLDQNDPGVARRTYGAVGPVIASARHPLFWDVAKGKWDRKFVAGDGPGGRFEGVTEYIPSLKKTFRMQGNQVWFYDYAAGAWTAGAKGLIGSYEMIGCHDSKRERIYVGHEKAGFSYFDIKTGTWHKVEGEGQPAKLGTSSDTYLNFDSANGVLIWKKRQGPVFVYDPDADKWTDLGNRWTEQPSGHPYPDIESPKFHVSYMIESGFYNSILNAHCFYLAGDSGNANATMLAYRYRRATDQQPEKGN